MSTDQVPRIIPDFPSIDDAENWLKGHGYYLYLREESYSAWKTNSDSDLVAYVRKQPNYLYQIEIKRVGST